MKSQSIIYRERERLVFLTLLLLIPSLAEAHTETNTMGGFIAGVEHPLTGLDHIAAMVAVGLWGAFLEAPAIWLLPVVFPLVMSVGGGFGIIFGKMPGVEFTIALSGVVLGAVVLAGLKPPIWVAACIVGFFAFFHGYSHGVELPKLANPFLYAVGFVMATGFLHLTGIALGLLTYLSWGRTVVRALGVAIMGVGFAFMFGFLS
jgi:urease accessory protein